jgi:type I restriction enzyme S subunit
MVEWSEMKLSDICDFVKIRTDDYSNYVSTDNMLPDNGGITKSNSNPTGSVIQYLAGDVLVSNIRPYLHKIWFANHDGGCSADVLVFRAKNNCYTKFLHNILSADRFFDYATFTAIGTKMPRGDKQAIMDYDFVFPKSIPAQRAIAAALADADSYIAALKRLIAKKRDIKQGAMQELLTGKRRLSGFTEKWDFDRIKNLATITTGAKNTQDKIEDGLYPFFVRSQIVERINTYSFDGEAVLTAGDGVGTGKVVHYINGKFDFHQRVYRISNFSERVDGYFFYLYFSTAFLRRIMSMTAKSSVDSVRMEMIADMLVPLPKKNEQIAIAQVLSNMSLELEALEQKRDKYRKLKVGMMQQLLTGRIRLKWKS